MGSKIFEILDNGLLQVSYKKARRKKNYHERVHSSTLTFIHKSLLKHAYSILNAVKFTLKNMLKPNPHPSERFLD